MTRMFVCVLFTALAVFGAAPDFRPLKVVAIPDAPDWAELDRFPAFKGGALPARVMADRGLRPVTLDKDHEGLMWNGKTLAPGRLKKGEVALVDERGIPRYKAACGNRFAAYPECPECPPAAAVTAPPPSGGVTSSGQARQPGFWSRLTDSLKNAALGMWRFLWDLFAPLGWLLLLLLGLLLLPFLAYLLYRLVQAIRERPDELHQPPQQRQPAPAQQAGAGAADRQAEQVAVNPPLPGQPPQPAPGQAQPVQRRFVNFEPADDGQPNLLRFGGYREVRFEAGADGVNTLRFR